MSLDETDFSEYIFRAIFRAIFHGVAWLVKGLRRIIVWLVYEIIWRAIKCGFEKTFGRLWKNLKRNKK